ncbi:VCBS domain-containing protein, partial [Gilvimarinus xylanilyticus]
EIVISITGTDDGAIITGGDTGEVTEDLDVQPVDQLVYTDQLEGDDVDFDQDQVDPSQTVAVGSNTLGNLDIQADGNWTYTVANALTQYLAVGQTKLELFQITTVGGTEHIVAVTINGTNDVPTLEAVVANGDVDAVTLPETNQPLASAGTLTAGDVDVRDSVTPSVTSLSTAGNTDALDNAALLSMFSVDAVAVIANGATEGTVNWSFDSADESF